MPQFYWENTFDKGSAIEGTPVPLKARSDSFPVQFNNVHDQLTLYRLDEINEDCILGSEFLARVSPFSVDTKKLVFTCIINNHPIELPIFFHSSPKCPSVVHNSEKKLNPAHLLKMERCIVFSETHGNKALDNIKDKLVKECCSESPNAFWKREKYFVSLPFDSQQKIKPMKASA